MSRLRTFGLPLLILITLFLGACQGRSSDLAPGAQAAESALSDIQESDLAEAATTAANAFVPTPFPPRPLYSPGELVDYTAQTGDTLPALAARFNTTVEEILEANPFIPDTATTMPPGMPMQIPIYYLPLWGSPYRILPDGHFIDGPSVVDFDIQEFVAGYPGWLNDYKAYAAGANSSGAEIVEYVALRYSVSPRLLLALLEYQAGALSNPELSDDVQTYTLGYNYWDHEGVYLQLNWAANLLNNGYYEHRAGRLHAIEHPDGRMVRIDPWLNSATASLHYYFNQIFDNYNSYARATSSEGLASTYAKLFGNPWSDENPHIAGSLTQPAFSLPFEPGNTWAYTGGPHSPWGVGEPFAALDFAPPDVRAGSCEASSQSVTAIADGVVVRSETGVVVLDLDGDGDERTGWNIFYLHLARQGRVQIGDSLQQGDAIGYPSCEGGTSTGTHIHLARKYNGEWMLAEGTLAFNLEGWEAHNGNEGYQGTLTRGGQTVTACVCSNAKSFVTAGSR